MSLLEKVTQMGKDLGLTDDKLVAFVEKNLPVVAAQEDKDKEREERRLERESKLESERLNAEAEKAKQEAQRQAQENEKAMMEKKIKAEQEAEERRLQAEEKRMQQEWEIEKLKADTSIEHSRHESTRLELTHKPKPKIPFFDEKVDEMDSYLERFDWVAEGCNWDKKDWPYHLSQYLKGKATDAYIRLSPTDRKNYHKVKEALLERFNLTQECYRKNLREAEAYEDVTPAQLYTRIKTYVCKWIALSGGKDLLELVAIEQFIGSCPEDLAVHLRQTSYESSADMCDAASLYLHARGRRLATKTKKTNTKRPENTTPGNKDGGQGNKSDGACFICKEKAHIARNCPQRGKKYCSHCKMNNHNTADCRRPGAKSVHAAAATTREDTTTTDNTPNMGESTEIILNGKKYVNSAVCKDGPNFTDGATVTFDAEVNGQQATVIRDTGCSCIVVNAKYVQPHQFTGESTYLRMADASVREAKYAHVSIRSPFYNGVTKAAVMERTIYDLLIGNIDGARPADQPLDNWKDCAVTTRAQAAKEKAGDKPLVIDSTSTPLSLGKDQLVKLQKDDSTLERFFNSQEVKEKKGCTTRFVVRNNILYREYTNPKSNHGKPVKQLMVPSSLRKEVLQKAHDCIMSGHLGVKKTTDRVLSNFFWPGLNGDVIRFCQSCDICQKTVKKGSVMKVPVQETPLIDTPFKRCAVDLVGPINPPSEKGHRYILTLVDYATRYPEAAPLKNIDSATVAEALLDMYSRVGIPEEVISDQGTQFISDYMKEFTRLLGMRQLPTSPYHAMANGLVEKFNGTLKSMLKKLCAKEPRQWHRFINAALFAYREVPQESTGFAPFELLYGRTVRGPMYILRQLWTKEDTADDVKTSYQHVFELRERLDDMMEMALASLKHSQGRYKHYFDKKAKQRDFKPGDKVLILLPTDGNKLLMHWQGPFTVEEKVRLNDYVINIKGKRRTYHANMLKRYYEREVPTDPATVGAVMTLDAASAGIINPEIGEESEEYQDGLLELYQGKQQTETTRDVILGAGLENNQQLQLMELLDKFGDIFSDLPGNATGMEHSIQLTTDVPVKSKPYGLPYRVRETLKEDINDMLKMGVIRPSTSPYASPTVIVKKPDGSNRICIDYRKLNRITVFDPEPMIKADDLFQKLSGDKYFTKLDLSKGYWQIPVRKEDISKTAFVTPDGHYEFIKMPFGMVNSGATLVRGMRKLLGNLKGVDNYIDDILVHSESWEEHIKLLTEVFNRLAAAGLTVRPSKCRVGETNVEFIGHQLQGDGIKPIEDNLEKIRAAPRPTDKTQVRSFLGLTGYYREYIPHYSTIASPLTDLTKKGEPKKVRWQEPQEKAYTSLKTMLTSAPILRLPDVHKPFVLRTDASDVGLGAVLMQAYEGKLFPVSYASRKLLDREKNYSAIEKECLAVVWAIKKYLQYLYGVEFTLQTDHQPLVYINQAKFENSRVMRWAMYLQNFRIKVESIKGKDNVGADYLSRIDSEFE